MTLIEALWLLFVFGLPALCSAWASNKVWTTRGPDGFRNPGGWKFPLGEVAIFGGAFVGVAIVLAVALVLESV
jgi:hypothetical protein